MPVFRIHRLKDTQRQQFRWAPHVSGAASVRPKDYELAGEIEAETEYAAWAMLRSSERPLQVGDILELPLAAEGAAPVLRICKYVGFEEARWVTPEHTAAGIPDRHAAVTVPGSAQA
jgi:hypothetical protein